jgi:DNA-binding IscR family transcriptional regulator
MEKVAKKNLTTCNILTAIKLGRELLDYLAANSYDKTSSKSVNLSDSVSLSRLQYYRRISRLMKVGLVKRKRGRYLLTPFGMVIYDILRTFDAAVDHHLKSTNTNTHD